MYLAPEILELGNAGELVRGDYLPYLEVDQTTTSTPVLPCDDPPGAFQSIMGCIE